MRNIVWGAIFVGGWLVGAGSAFAGTRTITVTGTVGEPNATVTVNEQAATVTDQAFSAQVTLDEGDNAITVVAVDRAGNRATASVTVGLDTVPPVLVITSPRDGEVFGKP